MTTSPRVRLTPSPAIASPGLLLLFCGIALILPGCAWGRWGQRTDVAFGPKAACRLPPHPTAEQIVDHLNQNVDRLQAWRAGKVKIRANNIPGLQADLYVQKDRHLRIMVSSFAGNEVDIGSNPDVFWFWAKRQEPGAVMYASHDQLELVRESLQIPFEPDWLMEALGVKEIAQEGTQLEPVAGTKTARLVSQHTTADGRQIRKAITVDTCHGRILEHSVWDHAGRRIAFAAFSDHRMDPGTGVVMAHHIKLEWPQADMSLAMDLGEVVINPPGLPERVWDMPHMPGYPVMNLQDLAERQGRRPMRQAERNEPAIERGSEEDLWQAHREVDEPAEPADLDAEFNP